jgi:hypothetical protein
MLSEKRKKRSDAPCQKVHVCTVADLDGKMNGSTTLSAGRSRQQETCAPAESEIISRAVSGSLTAFEELVYLYEKRIYGFVFQSCRNEADAKEITQDTFVRAFQALNQFDLKYPFGPWLFAIARRKCIDFFRARRPSSDHEVPEIADFCDPLSILSRREERENLGSSPGEISAGLSSMSSG